MPGNLLSINSYHYGRGGADNAYLAHAKLFEAHGWRNTFYSMQHESNLPDPNDKYFAENIDYSARVSALKKIVHATRIIYSVEARRKISKLLDENAIDVAHVHSIYHHQSPSILFELRKRNIPIVMTAHDLKLVCPARIMMNSGGVCEDCKGGKLWNVVSNKCVKSSLAASTLVFLESSIHQGLKWYADNVSRVVTPSEFYRRKLIEWGWDPAQVVTVPNFSEMTAATHKPQTGSHLLYFGRIAPEKGLETAVRASARSKVALRIVGSGPIEEELRKLAIELGAPVEFVGWRSGSALSYEIDISRAVIIPSEWYENGPLSAIEANLRGKPIIAADIGGLSEIIVEGETGWLFPSGDVQSLAQTMESVASLADNKIEQMGSAALEFAKQYYSPERYYNNITEIYNSLRWL